MGTGGKAVPLGLLNEAENLPLKLTCERENLPRQAGRGQTQPEA